MIVLGLHGFLFDHDAAAALVVDGRIEAFMEEERFSRVRHAYQQPPHRSAAAVLETAGISLDDVDVVAFGQDLPWYFEKMQGVPWSVDAGEFIASTTALPARRYPELCFVRHHDAHAASAFHVGGLDDSAVLVVDGRGERECITLYDIQDGVPVTVRRWDPFQSLGFMYEAASRVCGFGEMNSGKTMGLAAYDESGATLPMHWSGGDIAAPIDPGLLSAPELHRAWCDIFAGTLGVDEAGTGSGDAFDDFRTRHPAVAGAAQRCVEEVMVGLTDYALESTGRSRLGLAGGVGLNCVANGLLLDHCAELYVQPAANDAGVALGAALWVAAQNGDTFAPMHSASLGTSYGDEEIRAAVREKSEDGGLAFTPVDDPVGAAVGRLLDGQIVGWFQGRMEVGPRALGNRSILALAQDHSMKDRVNLAKRRELWRPLAPSLLREEMVRLFGRDVDSPFMLLSLPLTPWARDNLPAVAHVDGSARPQTVPADGSRYRDLLERVAGATGVGAVLNTSFNEPGRPIVRTPGEAIDAYCALGIDSLVIGNCVLSKR